jgi:hypothetical protein
MEARLARFLAKKPIFPRFLNGDVHFSREKQPKRACRRLKHLG